MMDKDGWKRKTTNEAAARRAGGRTRYNRQRQVEAFMRQAEVLGLFREGLTRAEIARRVGVHRSTVGRDLQVFVGRWVQTGVCPVCGRRLR